MPRNSEFIAARELAADADQRRKLATQDARARDAMRRALVTRNDRLRARASRRSRVAGFLVILILSALGAVTVSGFFMGA